MLAIGHSLSGTGAAAIDENHTGMEDGIRT
jgi:hypothetical protein